MKNKLIRAICAVIMVIIILAVLPSCRSDNRNAMEGTDYVRNSNNFSLFIPESWACTLADDALSARAPDGSSVTVAVFDYTTDEYMTIDLAWKKVKENFPIFFNGTESIIQLSDEESKSKIDGIEAGRYLYTGTVAGVDMKYEQYLTIYGTRVFQMVFSSKRELFDSHAGEFADILSFFSFSDKVKTHEGYKLAAEPEITAYESDKFTVMIDRDWIIDSSTGILTARYASGFPSAISFVSADMGDFDNIQDYWYSYKETFEKSLKDFTIAEDDIYHGKEDEISGHKAMSFVFTGVPALDSDNKEAVYKYCQVLIENGNEVIICTYSSSADRDTGKGYYDTHFEFFRNVLDLFEINA